MFAYGADIREVRFEFVADTCEVSVNRSRFNVERHEYGEETECVGRWADGEMMNMAEIEVGGESGGVNGKGARGESVAKGEGTFMDEAL